MDQKAQISIEYILLVAIILAVVLVFALIITDQNEQNSVATAAQLGASNATANMLFTNTSQSPVKVTSVTMTNVNSTNINMVIHFSGPITNNAPVIGSIINSLQASGYSNITNTSSSLTLTTTTSGAGIRHIYTITFG
jgi:uncharacterized protein (UPF0333 family)